MYHLARRCAYVKTEIRELDGEELKRWQRSMPITEEQEAPYFTPGTKEFKWRKWFNKLCDKLDENGLREKLKVKENRIIRWAEHDVAYIGPTLMEYNPMPYPTSAPSMC